MMKEENEEQKSVPAETDTPRLSPDKNINLGH